MDFSDNIDLRAKQLELIPGLYANPFMINAEHSGIDRSDFITKHVPLPELPHRYHPSIKTNSVNNFVKGNFNDKDIIINLSKRLEGATIPMTGTISANSSENDNNAVEKPKKLLVTETMATIYEQQNHIAEALKAYKQLAEQSPKKKDYYDSKIIELEQKLTTAQSE